MIRIDKRLNDHLRPVTITRGYLKHAEGSVLITVGDTKVICTASVEERVPGWRRGQGVGWVTAEYGMIPRATNTRVQREGIRGGGVSGRTAEIQRLIGRSLRAVTNLAALGERTIYVDCDVIQADGGTRTAAITGAMVALIDAVAYLKTKGVVRNPVLEDLVAAVSVGILADEPILDLCYEEDAGAQVDMNLVMTAKGGLVEIQGTAEGKPFSRAQLNKLMDLGEQGIRQLMALQKETASNVLTHVGLA